MKNEQKSEHIMTKRELKEILGKERTTIWRWMKKGILPPPLNHQTGFAGKIGRTSELFWNRAEMNKVLRQLGVIQTKV
ncbi:MAG: hypothetical protein LUH49_01810 [Cloacibacillus porcorum]|uniref:helix-turn-helix transcriptional regulator n=1 Tax=Cloacibacillus porcorum TaxID=1197717 RepID=UPI0023F0B999|nr:hypothetical protein [Cloacibacillus porcorum]MCD7875698.1 hypothetical protein [Cloacibacillus porcorum]